MKLKFIFFGQEKNGNFIPGSSWISESWSMTEIASISSPPGILYQIVYFQSKDRIHGRLVGTNW